MAWVLYGLRGYCHCLVFSYLSGRIQYVRPPLTTSIPSAIVCRVPQGLVLGPILFLLYVADMLSLVQCHQLCPHAVADDTQNVKMRRVDDISSWMRANRLQLNPSKTKVLWCSSGRCQHRIPTKAVHVCSIFVQPVSTVQDLRVFIDANVSMKVHVAATVWSCFAACGGLYYNRPCWHSSGLLSSAWCWLESPVIFSTDQSVLNAAARLVFLARRSDHITPLLDTVAVMVSWHGHSLH